MGDWPGPRVTSSPKRQTAFPPPARADCREVSRSELCAREPPPPLVRVGVE